MKFFLILSAALGSNALFVQLPKSTQQIHSRYQQQNHIKLFGSREEFESAANKTINKAFDAIDTSIGEVSQFIDSLDPEPSKLSLTDNSYKSRTEINELVLNLEKLNPTKSPAQSSLINGVWELVVTGVSDPTLLIYQAIKLIPTGIVETSNITLTISSVQPRVKASTTFKVGSLKTEINFVTELEATNGKRLKETYKSGSIGSLEIPLSSVTILNRELLVTYLDDDLLIVRDFLGSPEVLRRVNKIALPRSSALTVPSTSDDVPSD